MPGPGQGGRVGRNIEREVKVRPARNRVVHELEPNCGRIAFAHLGSRIGKADGWLVVIRDGESIGQRGWRSSGIGNIDDSPGRREARRLPHADGNLLGSFCLIVVGRSDPQTRSCSAGFDRQGLRCVIPS